jgi:hypothetical protein
LSTHDSENIKINILEYYIKPFPNTPSWLGAQLEKAQGQLYLYLDSNTGPFLARVSKQINRGFDNDYFSSFFGLTVIMLCLLLYYILLFLLLGITFPTSI